MPSQQTPTGPHSPVPDKITVRLDSDLATALAAFMARSKKDQSTAIREAVHWFLMAEDPAYIEQAAQDIGRDVARQTGSRLYRTRYDAQPDAPLTLNDAPRSTEED